MVNLNWQPGMTLESIEKEAIQQAFAFYQKNKSATSRALEISVRTLETKLEKYAADDAGSEQRELDRRTASESFLHRQRFGHPVAAPTGPASAVGIGSGAGVEAQHDDKSNGGLHVESAQDAPAKQSVPVPVRKEVQELPSKQAASGGKHQRR